MLDIENERILIIAPHADDEILGCGGLIERACRKNIELKVIIAAVGNMKHPHNDAIITRDVRKKEVQEALNYLGCSQFEVMFDDKDSELDTIPKKELVGKLDQILTDFSPTMVFIPLPSYHQDHQVLFDVCISALRPNPSKQYKLIAMYEYPLIVWQHRSFWNIGEAFLDISDTIDKKIAAFEKHKSQLRSASHLISPQTVKKWAEMRGLEVGYKYAEKYYILKLLMN